MDQKDRKSEVREVKYCVQHISWVYFRFLLYPLTASGRMGFGLIWPELAVSKIQSYTALLPREHFYY